MPSEIVIGLFRTFGTAEDVRTRLVYDGVPEADIELRRLARDTLIPPDEMPQSTLSFVDWLFDKDMPQRYGMHITNGETAVCVRGRDPRQRDEAITVMRFFAPLDIDVVTPPVEVIIAIAP